MPLHRLHNNEGLWNKNPATDAFSRDVMQLTKEIANSAFRNGIDYTDAHSWAMISLQSDMIEAFMRWSIDVRSAARQE